MQLEAGKKYTDRRGRVYGPLVTVHCDLFGETLDDYAWYANGSRSPGKTIEGDLVAEYVELVQPESWYLHRDCKLTVLRVSGGRVTYFEDGIQGGSYDLKARAYILGEKITAEDARARITRKAETAVPAAPVESPDDWVTQDRVPGRLGIDYQHWSPAWGVDHWRDITVMDHANGKRHGYIDGAGDTLNLRCRRKDLQPVPPKTRTVVLKEWICWDDSSPDAVTALWYSDAMMGHPDYTPFDHEHPTGETRTIEIPVT